MPPSEGLNEVNDLWYLSSINQLSGSATQLCDVCQLYRQAYAELAVAENRYPTTGLLSLLQLKHHVCLRSVQPKSGHRRAQPTAQPFDLPLPQQTV